MRNALCSTFAPKELNKLIVSTILSLLLINYIFKMVPTFNFLL